MKNTWVYIGGPVTAHLDNLNSDFFSFYINIGKLVDGLGLKAYVPHIDIFDRSKYGENNVPSDYIYRACIQAVSNADLMIAYVGNTSLGVGMELEAATHNGTKIILLSQPDDKVSHMVTGSPNIIEHILFDNFDDAIAKLKPILTQFV